MYLGSSLRAGARYQTPKPQIEAPEPNVLTEFKVKVKSASPVQHLKPARLLTVLLCLVPQADWRVLILNVR